MIPQDEYGDLLNIAMTSLKGSDTVLDQGLYKYFRSLHEEATQHDVARGVALDKPVNVLQYVIVDVDQAQKRESDRLQKGSVSVASFFLTYLAELRKIICGGRKTP